MRILIDGYNLIAALPALRSFFPNDLERARKELCDLLARYKKARAHDITVVYDGQGGPWGGNESVRVKGIKEIFTAKGVKADDVIIRMARENPEAMVVVTQDREIELQCSKAGVAVLAPAEFDDKMMEAILLGDKGATYEDEKPEFKGTRKKGPSRRLKRKQKLKLKRKAKL